MLVRTWASLWQMEQSNHALQHGARMELRQHRVSVTRVAFGQASARFSNPALPPHCGPRLGSRAVASPQAVAIQSSTSSPPPHWSLSERAQNAIQPQPHTLVSRNHERDRAGFNLAPPNATRRRPYT